MDNQVSLQPALIIQHRPYRETSLLLDVFTRDFGIVPVLAKGVRKEKSKLAGLLLPFLLINISYLDRGELKLLTQVESVCSYPLQSLGLYCGFYVNELLYKFLHKHDPYPDLFIRYQRCLLELSTTDNIEQSLRYFELELLMETGYGIELDLDSSNNVKVEEHRRYNYQPQLGMVEAGNGLVAGQTLQALVAQQALDAIALQEAKLLLRRMLDSHLQGQSLKSRDVLMKIIKYL